MRSCTCGTIIAAAVALVVAAPATPARTVSTTVVISEVYGGGGNSGAPYNADFVELFNRSGSAVDLSTYSLQYTSATGTSWASQAVNLTGTIGAHRFFLVQMSGAGANGAALPTPDATNGGAFNMAATAGKLALLSSKTGLPAAACPSNPSIVDLIGYGATASCFEGTGPAPAPSNTLSANRPLGFQDTDQNATDFSTAAPTPQNSLVTTAVELASFTAARAGSTVTVRWRTGAEAGLLAFNLYVSKGGAPLNRMPIAALGGPAGRAYGWRGATRGTRFWLELVSANGARTLRGPVRVG